MEALQSAGEAWLAASHAAQLLPYEQRASLAVAIMAIGGVWLHFVVVPMAPGARRFLALLPLLLANACVPSLFTLSEVATRFMALLCAFWMGSWKAVGLACNRGPLAGRWSLGQLMALYAMPIIPREKDQAGKKGRLSDSAGTVGTVVRSLVGNILLLVTVAWVVLLSNMPRFVKRYLTAYGLYGIITVLMEGPAALLIAALGLEIVPPFDKPWLATSLADFWTRRWNNTIGLTLRALVYDPLVEGSLIKRDVPATGAAGATAQPQPRPSKARKLACTVCTFVASGLMHELCLFYIAPAYMSQRLYGMWFAFFFLQGCLCIGEALLLQRLRRAGVTLNPVLMGALVQVINFSTAGVLFWPPVDTYDDVLPRLYQTVMDAGVAALGGLHAGAARLGVPGVDGLIALTASQ